MTSGLCWFKLYFALDSHLLPFSDCQKKITFLFHFFRIDQNKLFVFSCYHSTLWQLLLKGDGAISVWLLFKRNTIAINYLQWFSFEKRYIITIMLLLVTRRLEYQITYLNVVYQTETTIAISSFPNSFFMMEKQVPTKKWNYSKKTFS